MSIAQPEPGRTAGVLRLEFELGAMAKASTVTEALNGGYESRPWQLESVTGGGSGTPDRVRFSADGSGFVVCATQQALIAAAGQIIRYLLNSVEF